MKSRGFVLVITLMIIAASVALISLAIGRVRAYRLTHHVWVEREKARLLAWGGISLAMGELVRLSERPRSEEEKKELARFIISELNHWQTFVFKEATDGIDGECQLYISCEQGKIDLNALCDFSNRRLKQNKKLYEFLNPLIAQITGNQEYVLEKVLEELFKKRWVPLEEVSALCTNLNERVYESLFMRDPASLAITDLFTVAGDSFIDPLFFSYSARSMLSLKVSTDKINSGELVALLESPRVDWRISWNKVLAPIYGVSYEKIPAEIRALFSPRSGARTFSVISYGRVGDATQKLCVFIEKNNDTTNTAIKQPFIIKRLYWL